MPQDTFAADINELRKAFHGPCEVARRQVIRVVVDVTADIGNLVIAKLVFWPHADIGHA